MKFKFLLSSALLAAAFTGNAQNKNMAYAITGDGNNDFLWMNIRQVDLSTGKVTKTVFKRSETPFQMTDVTNPKTPQILSAEVYDIASVNYPTVSMVACAAFDERTNKLFFTPMRKMEVRWMDMSSESQPRFYTLKPQAFQVGDVNDEAVQITRMVIGADGNGYALTNDANHLYRFTTGKNPEVVDMGNIVDAESNNQISIHSRCTSWGGDMIADAYGKLHVITANHHVFEIDPSTRIATYKGAITGLSANYTTNAAAVNEKGNIVVASANTFEGYYELNVKDLAAVKLEESDGRFNASDFANGNLLFQREATAANNTTTVITSAPAETKAGETMIFPNPITNNNFNVVFNNKPAGNYSVVLTDLAGRVLQINKVNIGKGNQSVSIALRARQAKGMFLVKVLDENKQNIATEKVLIQ